MCFSLLVSGDGVKIDEEMSNLLPSQKRKIRQKQRKAEARAKKGAEEKNEELSVSEVFKSRKRHVKPMNLDPHGEKLLQVDRVYLGSCNVVAVLDHERKRTFMIRKEGLPDVGKVLYRQHLQHALVGMLTEL
ncbi:uncharacterized protein LOC130718646 isoform X2 [Lotus japonicus]|nr:uncharacterized protein LOC130718646 isoform X2 [Lotus japonicus]XP_057425248.1 uncharacterized protein LOC130718646 isoform X2 [Lotus japonicus]XP_057425249.1 uncharacterized protein LOC130718646 isoform X2 [Lotus japonicus]